MFNSSLYDEKTFYGKFGQDLLRSESEVVIESPFIGRQRMKGLHGAFEELVERNVKVFILTRDPKEHGKALEEESEAEIEWFEYMGIQVLLCKGNHHRKLAIIDRKVLWEGSLNILSQVKSREIMRRIESKDEADKMMEFLKLERFLD